jgi:hypothetical protein
VHSSPSASRFARKCRSSNTISDPSGTDLSTAPHTVTAIAQSAPSSFSAAMFGRWRTWFESRWWPSS